MDVRCSRCGTEYEFDDALISERGTTVKCTNCGFQFKIFPSAGNPASPERWVVRTGAGRELVYTSLRELQRGIAEQKVGAGDLLSRGNQPPRALGSIAELEPFFEVATGKRSRDSDQPQRTLYGVAPPANALGFSREPAEQVLTPSPVIPVTSKSMVESARAETAAAQEADARSTPALPVDLSRTMPIGSPPSAANAPPPSSSRWAASRAASDSVPDSSGGAFAGTPMSPRVANWDQSDGPASSRAPVSSPRNLPPIEVANIRDSFKSYDELHLDYSAEDHHARVARSRWIAGVVIIGVLGLLGATVGRRYLTQLTGAAEVKSSSDARVAKFLNDGAVLAEEGDFEGAKEEFDKAAALAEKDPAVLTSLARLETLRADVSWLKLRLLDPNSVDLVQATYRELGRRVGKARTAVDRAFSVSPEDPSVLRARIDLLRLSGDGDKAREWLAPLSANSSVPENAYVLAALDLAEADPVWPSAIDRLRTAAAAERDPGRARAALIYALARANRLPEAEAEFAKVNGRAKPHPLLEELRGFLQRASRSVAAAGSAPPKMLAVDTTKLPKLDTSPAPDEPRAANGDFRARLAQASAALRQAEYARAEQLFRSVLSEQPNNTEALSGLGDVAKARRDPALASEMYDRVLIANPGYLPAIAASADQKWESGDRRGALVLYRRLIEQAGPSSEYGARAAARIAEGAAGNGNAGAPSAQLIPSGDAPATETAPSATPGLDPSDLPGAK